jgi:hypothetical protein
VGERTDHSFDMRQELLVREAGHSPPMKAPTTPAHDVFISYASRDRERVTAIADQLQLHGVRLWLDHRRVAGGAGWAREIVRAIKACKALLLMCSDAAMRSRAVAQEIQLAWKYRLSYLPLLLEQTSFPEQLEFFLEGCQWIETRDRPQNQWLPEVLGALVNIGVQCRELAGDSADEGSPICPRLPSPGLDGLRAIAQFTDRIWPYVVEERSTWAGRVEYTVRALSAPQPGARHRIRLGSQLFWMIQWEEEAHLLLLDSGPEGKMYCLCPSWFVPETRLRPGLTLLPTPEARCQPFVLTGIPGREHVLAILSKQPLGLDWMPPDSSTPARVLDDPDLAQLAQLLDRMPEASWTALSTCFDVVI